MQKYCTKCGKEVSQNSKFCVKCGAELQKDNKSCVKCEIKSKNNGNEQFIENYERNRQVIVYIIIFFVMIVVILGMFEHEYNNNRLDQSNEIKKEIIKEEKKEIVGQNESQQKIVEIEKPILKDETSSEKVVGNEESIASELSNEKNSEIQQLTQESYSLEDKGNYPSLPLYNDAIINSSASYYYDESTVYFHDRSNNTFTPVDGDLNRYSDGDISAYSNLRIKDDAWFNLGQYLSGHVVIEAGEIGNNEDLYLKDPGSCSEFPQDKSWFNKAGFKITLSN